MPLEQQPNESPATRPDQSPNQRRKSLPIFLILLLMSIPVMLLAGPPASTLIFFALLVSALIVLIDRKVLRLPPIPLKVLQTAITKHLPMSGLHRITRALDAIRASLNRRRMGIAVLFMIFALIAMILSAQSALPSNDIFFDFTTTILWMLVGLGFLWTSLRFAAPPVRIAALTSEPLQPGRSNLLLVFLGALLLFATGEASGKALKIDALDQLPVPYHAILFYGGIFFLVLGLGGVSRFRRISLGGFRLSRPQRSWLADPRMEIVIVLLIFLGALLIRVWGLDPGLRASLDEALAVDGVMHYYVGKVGLVAPPSQYITTLLFPQWQGVLMNILGKSVMVLRLTSAITGALTVVVTYFLARDLFDDRLTGWIAALFLMTFPPHVHFSRISLLHIADPLFGALAIWFVIRGIRWNRRLDWAFAGASLGLTQYFFEAGRLFYFPLVVVWLGAVVALIVLLLIQKTLRHLPGVGRFIPGGRAALPRIPLKGIWITFAAFVLVAMPTYYAVASLGGDANPRLSVSGGFNLFTDPLQDGLTEEEAVVLVRRIFFPFSIYVHQPEIGVYYGGDQPLMLVYVVPFFLLGIGYLLWRWRSPAFVLVLWIVATAGINALLRDSAVYTRWIVVLPGVAVVVAVGLRYLLPVLLSHGERSADDKPILVYRRSAVLLVGAVLVVKMVAQVNYYFNEHVPLLEKQVRLAKPYGDVFDLALRSFDFPDATDIYMIGDPLPDINVPRSWIDLFTRSDRSTLRYFPLSPLQITPAFIEQRPLNRNLALFVDPSAHDAIALMQASFGCDMQHSPYPIDPPEKEFLLCFVPMPKAG